MQVPGPTSHLLALKAWDGPGIGASDTRSGQGSEG